MAGELDNIKGQDGSTNPTIDDINSYYPEGLPQPQKQYQNPFTPNGMDLSGQVTSPGALRPEDYNPVNHTPNGNIYKGSYSGSIVGNIPIFVDNQDISFAPEHARQQALQMAAANKASEIKKLEADLYKTPQLKNAPDQPEMNDIYLNGIDKWKQMYQGDVVAMQQDPKFRKWREDVKTAGKINDAAFEQYAQMGKEMDEGKKYFSEDSRKMYQGFLSGMGKLGDPTDPEAQNFTAKAFKLNQSYDLDMAVNQLTQHYKPQVTETGPDEQGAIKSRGVYDTITTKKKTNEDREAINKLADDLYNSKYKGTGTFTQEEVRRRVQEALPYSEENTVQTHANQFAPRADAAPKETYSLDQKEPLKKIMTVSRKGEGETSFDLTNVYKTNTTDQAKQVTYTLPPGLKYTDGSSVSDDASAGNVKGVVSEIGVAKVYKPGLKMPVKTPGKVVKGVQTYDYIPTDVGGMVVGSVDVKPDVNFHDGMYINKPVAMFNVTETQGGEAGKNAPNKTIVAPIDAVSAYAKSGKKPGELDLTDMAEDVKRQAKLQEQARLAKVAEYNASGKNTYINKGASPDQKKSVSSGNKDVSKNNTVGKKPSS